MRPGRLLALLSAITVLLLGVGVLALALLPDLTATETARATRGPTAETGYAALTILTAEYENHFPDEMVFRLEAAGPEPIEKVTLYFTSETHGRTSYAYPEFEPGTRVQAEYRLNTRKNYIVPSTLIRYYFLIEDAGSNELRSPERSFRYDDVRFSWKSLQRGDVTVYWYSDGDRQGGDVMQWAVGALERLSQEFGVEREKPIRIYVYANKTDMDSARPPTSETFSRETVTLGEAHAPEVLLILGATRGVQDVVYHEMSHLVVGQLVGDSGSRLPRWLDEGLAMYAEGDLDSSHKLELQRAIASDRLMSVPSISSQTGDPNLINLFYAESYSVVKYLIDAYGRDKLHQLLLAFRDGASTNAALTQVYGFDQQGLDERWRVSLGARPRP